MFLNKHNKEFYLKKVDENKRVPLFFNPEVLDLIARDNWNVILSKNHPNLAWVFTHKKTFGFNQLVTIDPLGYNGIVAFNDSQDKEQTETFIENIIQQTGNVGRIYARLDYLNYNPQSKSSLNLLQKPVFIIKPNDFNQDNYKSSLSRQLKKFTKSEAYITIEDDALNAAELSIKAYSYRNMKPPYNKEVCIHFMNGLIGIGKGKVITAFDKSGKILASIAIGIDHQRHYYLFGGVDRSIQGNSGHPAVLDYAIRNAVSENKVFDFQGSSIPGVANYFSKFGASKIHYHELDLYPNKMFKRIKSLRRRF